MEQQLPFMLLIFVVFIVFFMILPQNRQRKKEKEFLGALKKGDRVITKGGMHGKITELNDKDNSCVIETLAGKIKFDRSALSMEGSRKLNAPAKK